MPAQLLASLMFALILASRPALCAIELIEFPPQAWMVTDDVTGVDLEVSIDGFLISATELSQRQFEEVAGYNPSVHRGENLPVENVNWWETIRFCNLKSERDGLEPCYNLDSGDCDLSANGWRLPTEAEWLTAFGRDSVFEGGDASGRANLGSANDESLEVLHREMREKTTVPVGTYQPNTYGAFNLLGNVREWCTDNNNPLSDNPMPLHNPAGPRFSAEKVVRGGSFFSHSGSWARGYNSAVRPGYKSRYLGIRLCRSSGVMFSHDYADPAWFEPYNRRPAGYESSTGTLSRLLEPAQAGRIATAGGWEQRRRVVLERWEKLLGMQHAPRIEGPPQARLIREYDEDAYSGRLMYLRVEPDYWEKIYLMLPRRPLNKPAPVVIVPYYDVDTPAAQNMGGKSFMPPSVRSFAHLAVRSGYIACAVRWFGEGYSVGYAEAVAELNRRHPGLSGLGKWVSDVRALLDWLYTRPEVDRRNIGIIGHSLGGKMSMYAAAFEPRITAIVGSEHGIGIEFSNYEDYWYLDGSIRERDPAVDHHELLGLIAPRPFLLIGGESADNDSSWHFINEARKVYALYGHPEYIGYFNHRTGHTPTPEAVTLSLRWLERFLGPGN
ncbi:MAG: SUMF1/EgtB/PvdO family nonheme iron enzyme [Candidatus Glassbacteria bacterium]|nr:SUMF1/EgtB/PvdO family nonheme iron enzyme [Candidatus Glassbacteria bacterium]